ncbi:hypothetical protein ACVIIW_006852 [Bradyrhizobium sp. USDA 4449]
MLGRSATFWNFIHAATNGPGIAGTPRRASARAVWEPIQPISPPGFPDLRRRRQAVRVSGASPPDGHDLTCVDKDDRRWQRFTAANEPGLDGLAATNVRAKWLDFTTDLSKPDADAVFIAVRRRAARVIRSLLPLRRCEIDRAVALRLHRGGDEVDRACRHGDEVERTSASPRADVLVASNREFHALTERRRLGGGAPHFRSPVRRRFRPFNEDREYGVALLLRRSHRVWSFS